MKIQIVWTGIGGQGILFSSKIFSDLGLRLGLRVLGSETHGMSQRGGSVISFIKLGNFHSPLIRTGSADILYSLDIIEAYKALKFLKEGGLCFVNLPAREKFDDAVSDYLKKKRITVLGFDACDVAKKTGTILTTNIVLIGFSLGTGLVPFGYDELKGVLNSVSKKKNIAINLRALERGFQQGRKRKKDMNFMPDRN